MDQKRDRTASSDPGGPVSFTARLLKSERFDDLYKTGMALVDAVGDYLDGSGRAEARSLPREVAGAYADESMRLSTRLMQIAAWLLVQKSINDGGLLPPEAGAEKNKVRLSGEGLAVSASLFARLPEALQELVAQSLRLQASIIRIEAMTTAPAGGAAMGVQAQIDLLRRAFAASPTAGPGLATVARKRPLR